MSDERLSRGTDSLMGRLLAAGDRDEPSPRAVKKTLLAVGVVSGLGGASSVASASTVTAVAIVKWVALGAIVGASVSIAGGAVVDRARPAPPPVATMRQPAVATPDPEVRPNVAPANPEPPPAPSASAASNPSRGALPPIPEEDEPAPAPSAERDTLKDETPLIERAGNAVRRHDGASALQALGEYRARFPRGKLSLEASVIEIEALVAAGQREAAKQSARRFLAAHPESPSAKHVRSIAGLSE